MALNLEKMARAARSVSSSAPLPTAVRNKILNLLAAKIRLESEDILRANAADVSGAKTAGRNEAFLDRLALDASSIEALAAAVDNVASLPDPVGAILLEKTLENAVRLTKRRVPLGVIAVIYESRPGVTIDAAALCFKTGNAVILKGGSEAIQTNRLLAHLFGSTLKDRYIAESWVQFIDSTDRADTLALLKQHEYIDVVIPRGGYELVRFVVENAHIPALYHAAGIGHIYMDASADLALATRVCLNAKTNRPATCNTVDTLLIHETIAGALLPSLLQTLQTAGVRIKGDEHVRLICPDVEAVAMNDFDREYLSLTINIAVVVSVQAAITHITVHGSRHTEGIIASDQSVIDLFTGAVDAAAICVNCSTRLHDGGVFGLGAEMGIATGKLHARGPVGLEELCSYQWVLCGQGQVRT